VVLKLIRRPVIQIFLYFFLINGIFISASVGAGWFLSLSESWPLPLAWKMGYWLLVGLLASPFLFAVIRNLNAMAYILTDALFSGKSSRPVYQHRLQQMLSAFILGIFLVFIFLIFLLVAAPYIPNTGIAGLAFLVMALALVFMRSRLIFVNSQMELLFMESFHEEVANREDQRREEVLNMIQKQAPWPVDIVDLTLPQHARGQWTLST
jgi:hypothetical protein